MRIRSADIPQADRIESMVLATAAIANGARTDIQIANAVPGIVGDARQGRYYRKAAQILGFVTNQRNNAQITPLGNQLVRNPATGNPVLLAAVLKLNLYQKLIPFLELHPEGLTRNEILTYLESIADENIGATMLPRRISSIIAWIKTLGLLIEANGRFSLSRAIIPSLPVIEFKDIAQPLIPVLGSLDEYQAVAAKMSGAAEVITFYKDLAKQERANVAHTHLVNLVADRIRKAGGVPKSNSIIDLATKIENDFIFEMKSLTTTNCRSQIRKGISQLYEYRYLESNPSAQLVLVLEAPVDTKTEWMLQYLESDRGISVVWDGNDNLYGSVATRSKMPFLDIIV